MLDRGEARVAERINGTWTVHDWIKKAILMYFRVAGMQTYQMGPYEHDKIPLKTNWRRRAYAWFHLDMSDTEFPGAWLCVMPGYVNIGAYVGAGTMVDTWATVGSCAQIGAGVHLSGGVGIGGVLEPPSASPVIIEDGAFIGSRAIVVEESTLTQER